MRYDGVLLDLKGTNPKEPMSGTDLELEHGGFGVRR